MNIQIENKLASKKVGDNILTHRQYATQRLKMSRSEMQLDKFNNTLHVMGGPMFPTPIGSPLMSFDEQQDGKKKSNHKRTSTLSINDQNRDTQSFNAALRSSQLGQSLQNGSLVGQLQTPLLES